MRLPIASLPAEKVERFRRKNTARRNGPLRCFAGGNMIGSKGLFLALHALAMARRAQLDFQYTIAGGGPEIPAMKRLTAALGLSGHVAFHDGYQGSDYIDALHDADVYLLPSLREGTPVTLLEAMLAGCYPVVANASAQGEIVRESGGHAVTADDIPTMIRGLADALLWCGKNRERLAELASAGSSSIQSKFSSTQYDETIELAYSVARKSI